jgi:hypothetical protein
METDNISNAETSFTRTSSDGATCCPNRSIKFGLCFGRMAFFLRTRL